MKCLPINFSLGKPVSCEKAVLQEVMMPLLFIDTMPSGDSSNILCIFLLTALVLHLPSCDL